MNKLIIILILLFNISAIGEDKFSIYMYKQDNWNIFLYFCTKTAECLNVRDGWSEWKDDKKDHIHTCILHGEEIGAKDIEISDFEQLQTIFSKCRSNSLELLK